ncbi:MarR family transcriptional regulator [Chelativorans sp.]|uniref:MarR family winged helix-turn-helix transcriptional regulator n=1 Tax=Chelativorans sp. TaxID=2203393 RepID=UPI00281195CD|nr:MarR family transcriptional regulator [Chelativorans sp.]
MNGPAAAEDHERNLLENIAGIRIRRLQGLFLAHWQKWFSRRGLKVTPVQGGVLLLIRRYPDLSQNTLARLLRIEAPTLQQTLGPLLEQGFVARRRSQADGRIFELRLSEAGVRAAALVEAETPRHEADLLRNLSAEERALFLALLDKAIAGGEAAIAAQDPSSRETTVPIDAQPAADPIRT